MIDVVICMKSKVSFTLGIQSSVSTFLFCLNIEINKFKHDPETIGKNRIHDRTMF